MIPKPLAVAVLTLVTLVWGVDFGAQFVTNHQPSAAIQGTFLALVGGSLIRAGWVARKEADKPDEPQRQLPPAPQGQQEEPERHLEVPPTIPPPPLSPPENPYRTWRGDGRHQRPRLALRGAWT